MADLVDALGDPDGVVEHRLGGVDLVRTLRRKSASVSHAQYYMDSSRCWACRNTTTRAVSTLRLLEGESEGRAYFLDALDDGLLVRLDIPLLEVLGLVGGEP